ncbi:MAG: S8 family serine peptidase [Bacteroidia bacterium]|nr:S8 family serine peptidase [Bacteroidia bacterium]
MITYPIPLRAACWCLALLPAFVSAQTEVNVRLQPQASLLQAYLERPVGTQRISTELAAAYPFVADIQAARSPGSLNRLAGTPLEGVFTLTLTGEDLPGTLTRLRNSGAFEFVEENRRPRVDHAPAAPALIPNDDSLANQWYHTYIQTYDAWDLTQGDPSVRIGVIDTGLDYEHPEFAGQLWINPAEDLNQNNTFEPWPASEVRNGLTGDLDGTDADFNGYADDVIGYDFTDQPRSPYGGDYLFEDPDPLDDNSHGTLVSGVIGARQGNQYGGSGLAPGCKLVTLRAFAANGGGEDDDIARAIVYAADNGIRILNFSFGDVYPSAMMQAAIQYAWARGVIMVGSAGNGTGDNLHYPSGFPEVISVSASTRDTRDGTEYLWPLSSYGLTVDLCAPGARIFTPTLRDADDPDAYPFTYTQGTSFSAPIVTSGVALLSSYRGYFSPAQTRAMLATTADDIADAGWDHFTGAGRVNLLRLLEAGGSSVVALHTPAHESGSPQDTVYITGTALDPEFLYVSVEYQAGTEGDDTWETLLDAYPYQVRDDTLARWILTGLPEGTYTLRLRVQKTDGFTLEDRSLFVRDKTPPEVQIQVAAPAWDNEIRKYMLVFRSSDIARHTLLYRRAGAGTYSRMAADRISRSGSFLAGDDILPAGTWELALESVNQAGLVTLTSLPTTTLQPAYLTQSGWTRKPYALPLGRLLPGTFDLDNDGFQEVIQSEYRDGLSFGRVKWYEIIGPTVFVRDSVQAVSVLIPKDIADTDGDGLQELLASVNDTTYIFEQAAANTFPAVQTYFSTGDTLYAARFADTDLDGQQEIILKNFQDYFVYESAGNSWVRSARLRDISPDYQGSVAPRAEIADFDGDGRAEIAFGDFDGDVLVYEHQGGQTYAPVQVDTTRLTKSGPYLTAGDFDGDGREELFVAVHTSSLRNDDFEYETPYWWLRIIQPATTGVWSTIWEEFLYDIDTEEFNAATVGNLDADPADELVFTTFPRTYVLEQTQGGYGFTWFQYGALATHHVIGDLDQNGISEVGIGRGDSTFFYEKNLAYAGPQPVVSLKAKVLGPAQVQLDWTPAPGATQYEIWRVRDPARNDTAVVTGPVTGTRFTDAGLTSGTEYLYAIRSLNPGLTPPQSGFEAIVVVQPHALPRLDSAVALGPRQVAAWFSQPMMDRPEDLPRYQVNQIPPTALARSQGGRRILLSLAAPLAPGTHTLRVDSSLTDAGLACMNPAYQSVSFSWAPRQDDLLYLTQWRATGDKTALLRFNLPLDETTALDTARYTLSPAGSIVSVSQHEDPDAVIVTIREARFGALGYPLTITVGDVCAVNGTCMGTEGNAATFSAYKDDLSEVFAYPNPVRNHQQFEGMRFANLTQQAQIRVISLSGRLVQELEETDGDGGLTWDLRDKGRQRIPPGIYIYEVTTQQDGIEAFVGKFTVVE